MATTSPNLRVRISADLADIKQGLGALRSELSKVQRDATRAAKFDTSGFEGGLRRIRGLVAGLAAGLGGALSFRQIIRETGQGQAALAQMRAALKSTGEVAGLTERQLVDMANNFATATTHSAGEIMEAQVRLLSYSGIAAKEFPRALQLAIDQSVRLGENVLQSAETVGKALEYPAQGVSALTKQGFRFSDAQKELLKDLEKTGRLAEAQAIVMGVMEESYKGAALAASRTLPGALAQLRNAFRELLDAGEGSASTLALAIGEITQMLRSPEIREGFADIARGVLDVVGAFAKWVAQDGAAYIKTLTGAIVFLLRNLDLLIVYLGTRLAGAAIVAAIAAFARLRAIIVSVTTATITLRTVLLALGGPVGIAIAAVTTAIYFLWKRTNDAKVAAEEHSRALDENERLSREIAKAALEEAAAKRAQALKTLDAARAILEEKKARMAGERTPLASLAANLALPGLRRYNIAEAQGAQAAVDAAMAELDDWSQRVAELAVKVAFAFNEAGDATGAVTAGAEDGKKAVRGMVDALELLQDAARRALAELERRFEAGELGIAEYFARKRDAELASIDVAIRQAQEEARVAKTSEQQSKALTEIIKLQRDRAEIGPRVAREQAAAEDELTAALGRVHIRLLEVQGETARARRGELEEEYLELIRKLQANGDAAGVALVRKLINIEAARAQLQQFQAVMQDAMAQLRNAENSIASQQQAGLLGVSEAERAIDDERQKALDTLRQLRESVLAYYEATKDPTVIPFLQELNGNIGAVAASQQQLRQQIADAAINSVTNLFTDLATGAKSAKDALRDFVLSFVQGMAQIAARALATFLVLKLLDAIYPGLGKMTAATMGAGQAHGGGIAGAGGSWRRVSPMLFGAAPRYHAGGIAGLAPNEVPAVLERGEEVLTRSDPRHRNNQRGGGQRPTRMIFVDDQRRVADFLNTPEGEDAVVEILGRNPGRVREVLA
jgi:hypothetical protein